MSLAPRTAGPIAAPDAVPAMASPMGRFGRASRLIRKRSFRDVLATGRRGRSTHLTAAVLCQGSAAVANPAVGSSHCDAQPRDVVGDDRRLGLSVAKTAGHAPARVRLRRLLRAAFRALRPMWPAHTDVVVTARVPWPDATLAAVVAELDQAVGVALRSRARHGSGGDARRKGNA